ncbi:1815_t:CDS:2 [Acaulospora colombiana]|uniref:1815_t:CDS:1 n=1 Tax=Acaulospora colombiana TaxID=27376 RepID=A0ACA9N5D4_9GLOM|nr:1815_t:CDS:2 [Acaulospora colombiana]
MNRDVFLAQVLVIPKPAGPRRFLNALHTTTNKIVVDPVYMPIATSPMSPGTPCTNESYLANGVEVNPMEHIGEQPNNYFPPDASSAVLRSNTPSPSNSNVPRPVVNSNGSPSSPRGIVIFPRPSRSAEGRTSKIVGKSNSASTTPIIYTSSTSSRILSNNQSPGTLSPTSGLPPTNFFPEIPTAVPASESPSVLPNAPMPTSPQPTTPAQQPSTATQNQSSHRRKAKPAANRLFGVIPPINVLIVEDNPINQTILSTFMRKKKIKFECAANGQEAVEKWQKGGFHLVLMDIHMPVMDGIEATKTIRRLEKSQKIGVFPPTPPAQSAPSSASSTPASTPSQQDPPDNRSPVIIVALTASSLSSDKQNALAAGCNDFLTKPVSLEWLEKKINEWGCMQALIDFDGWRKWKKGGEETVSKSDEKKSRTSKSSGPSGDENKKGATATERSGVVRRQSGSAKSSDTSIGSIGSSSSSHGDSGQGDNVKDKESSNLGNVLTKEDNAISESPIPLKDIPESHNSVTTKTGNGFIPTSPTGHGTTHRFSSNPVSPRSHLMQRSSSGGLITPTHSNDAVPPKSSEILVKDHSGDYDISSSISIINFTDSAIANNATSPPSTSIDTPPRNSEPSQKRFGRKRGNTFSSSLTEGL